MNDDPGEAGPGSNGSTAEDWITIWESECRALADDREMREACVAVAGFWALLAREAAAWLDPPPSGDVTSGGISGTRAQARTAAAAAAPDAGDAALAELAGRVAELERRLAASFRGDAGG